MKSSVTQVAANSIGRESEQSPLLINENPIGHNCIKKKLGPTDFNQLPISSAVVNLSSERKRVNLLLITIMQNYEISSKVIKDYSFPSNQRQLPIWSPRILLLYFLVSATRLILHKVTKLSKYML